MPMSDVNIVLLYHNKEENYANSLLTYLKPLEQQNLLKVRSKKNFYGGQETTEGLTTQLIEANTIIYILSANFLSDDKLQQTIEDCEKKAFKIFCVLGKTCLYNSNQNIKVLPIDKVFHSQYKHNHSQFWTKVVYELAEELKIERSIIWQDDMV